MRLSKSDIITLIITAGCVGYFIAKQSKIPINIATLVVIANLAITTLYRKK